MTNETLFRLVELFEKGSIARLAFSQGDCRLELEKPAPAAAALPAAPGAPAPAPAAAEEKATAAEEKAASADVKAEEAKQAAAQAGASPAVTAAAKAYVNSCTTLTNSQVSDTRDLIEDFVQGAEYDKGMTRKYDGKFYRMAQDISATTSQTYLPGPGMESLYTLIDLAADGIRIWHTVTDATNSFALGEKCHHPGEDGPVYVSKRDGNFSEPGTDEWWELDGSEETGEADTGESEA